jgi:hypothetical protein
MSPYQKAAAPPQLGANGAMKSSACAGMCWTPLPETANQAASPRQTSTPGTNEGVGYFEVNQMAAGAGTPLRHFAPDVLAAEL